MTLHSTYAVDFGLAYQDAFGMDKEHYYGAYGDYVGV